MRSLHWLTVKHHIMYKILVYKILKNNEPTRLRELLIRPEDGRITHLDSDEPIS